MNVEDPKDTVLKNVYTIVQNYGHEYATQLVLEYGSKKKQQELIYELSRNIIEYGYYKFADIQSIKIQIKKLSDTDNSLIKDVFSNMYFKDKINIVMFLLSLGADINDSYYSHHVVTMEEIEGFKTNTVLCSMLMGQDACVGVPYLLNKGADPNVIYCHHRDIWPIFMNMGNKITDEQQSVLLQYMLDAGLDRKRKFPYLIKTTSTLVYISFDEVLQNEVNALKNNQVGTKANLLPTLFVWDVIQSLK